MGSLQETDALGASVATHPRVSLANIEGAIAGEWYCTGETITQLKEDGILTICILRMKNGFIVIGKSAPASPENFSRAVGEQFAREDAIRQLWPLMGFALRDRLSAQKAEELGG